MDESKKTYGLKVEKTLINSPRLPSGYRRLYIITEDNKLLCGRIVVFCNIMRSFVEGIEKKNKLIKIKLLRDIFS